MNLVGQGEGTTRTNQEGTEARYPKGRRTVVLAVLFVAAIVSVALLFWIGRHNRSVLVAVGFSLWVLSPYVVLGWAHSVSHRWAAQTRSVLQGLTWAIVLASLALYGWTAFGPPRPKPAFYFVLVPPLAWILMAVALPASEWISRRRSRPASGA